MKEELQIRVNSALNRGKPMSHRLLIGPAGSGKTTLAGMAQIAQGMATKRGLDMDAKDCMALGKASAGTPRKISHFLQLYRQSPIGISGLRQIIEMNEAGIIELERLPLKLDYIEKTGKGRELTPKGFRRINEILSK